MHVPYLGSGDKARGREKEKKESKAGIGKVKKINY